MDQGLNISISGYQNNRLVHKQQPADSAAFVEPQLFCSKPRPQDSRPQHSLKVNSSRRDEAISWVNWCISLGSKLMPKILTLELAEYLFWAWNKHGAQCCMASCMEWHLPVQERLAKAVPVRFKYHKDNCMNAFNKPCLFLSHTSKFYSPHPNTNCLAASNAVCTKRNKYSCSCSKMKLIITRRHDHLTSLATRLCFCSKLCLWKNTNNNMNMKISFG